MQFFLVFLTVALVSTVQVVVLADEERVFSKFEKTLSSSMKPSLSTSKGFSPSHSKKTHIKSAEIDLTKIEVTSTNTLSVFYDGFVGRTFYAPNSDSDCMSPTTARFERLNSCKAEERDDGFAAGSIGSQVAWSKKYDNYTVNVIFFNYESANCEWISSVETMGIPGIDLCDPPSAENTNERISYHYFDTWNLYDDFVPAAPGVVYSRYGSKGSCQKNKLKDLVTLNYFASDVCRNDNDDKGYYKVTCDQNQAPILELYGTDATCSTRLSFETAPVACGNKYEPASYVCVTGGTSIAPKTHQQSLRGEATLLEN